MNKILLAQMATLHSLSYPEHYIVQIYSFKLLKNNFDITIPIDNSPILVKVLNNKIKVNVPYYTGSWHHVVLSSRPSPAMHPSCWGLRRRIRLSMKVEIYIHILRVLRRKILLRRGTLRAWALSLSKLETIWKLADLTILKHSLSYTSRIGEFILILHKIVLNMFEE